MKRRGVFMKVVFVWIVVVLFFLVVMFLLLFVVWIVSFWDGGVFLYGFDLDIMDLIDYCLWYCLLCVFEILCLCNWLVEVNLVGIGREKFIVIWVGYCRIFCGVVGY